MVNTLIAFVLVIIHISPPPDKHFLEAPELEDKVPLYYLSHKEVYEESMRKLAVTVQKSREWEAKKKDGVQHFR